MMGGMPGSPDLTSRMAYRVHTRWVWWAAAVFVGASLLASMVAANLVMSALAEAGIFAMQWQVLGALAVSQVVSVVLILWAAGWRGDRRGALLALGPPVQGVRAYWWAYLAMAVLFGAISALLWFVDPKGAMGDLTVYSGLIRSDAWWLAVLVIVVGAPVMEELMFRGFLFPALARGPFGVVGAVLTTSAAWSALHAGYSVMGLLEVFAVGLYFAYVLVRTGSLRVPMFCHAAYNASALVLLLLVDIPAAAAG